MYAFIFLSIAATYACAIKVDCNRITPVCNCISPSGDDTCEFTLEVQHLQTFTRYEVMDDGEARGSAGRVWYIDKMTGEFEPHPDPTDNLTCYDPTVKGRSCTEPCAVDGYTFRSFIAVNGRIPGPTLIVEKDKYVKVHVLNQLASEAISIHWHGMHQRNSHWMDGVEHMTQCGIAPGTNFTYVFQAEQSGTHWYHSHSGAQRTEGLFGALIVKEEANMLDKVMKATKYSFQDLPEKHTLTLLDWQKENSIDLFTQIHSNIRLFNEDRAPDSSVRPIPRTCSVDGVEVGPVPYWSGLINGKGRHQDVSYTQSRLSIFTVKEENIYRFRLIGAQSLFAYRVSIDEHKMILIAMDGVLIEPVTFDYIIIHSGERFDFLLNTSGLETKQRSNFIIRAETLEAGYKNHIAEAILHYNTNAPPKSTEYESIAINSFPVNCTEVEKCRAFNCPFENYPPSYNINCTHVHEMTTLFPLEENELPDIVVGDDDKVFLNFGFEGISRTSAINARNMKLPSAPLGLLNSEQRQEIEKKEFCDRKSLKNQTVCNSNLNAPISPECTCTQVREIKKDHSIQMVFSAVGPVPNKTENFNFSHPVHLHGHYFHVVDIQFGEYDSEARLRNGSKNIDCGNSSVTELCNVPKWASEKADYSYEKKGKIDAYSPRRDTILIPAGGYAVVYFKANNPGYWFLHCHIEVHQLEGMSVVIGEAVDEATKAPNDLIRKCGNFSLSVQDFKDARAGGKGGKSDIVPVVIGCIVGVIVVIVAILCIAALCCNWRKIRDNWRKIRDKLANSEMKKLIDGIRNANTYI